MDLLIAFFLSLGFSRWGFVASWLLWLNGFRGNALFVFLLLFLTASANVDV